MGRREVPSYQTSILTELRFKMPRLSVFALLLLACSSIAFPDSEAKRTTACTTWCGANTPLYGLDCILQSLKGKGPCYECGPAAPASNKKVPCGGVCKECTGGKTCQSKECKCPADKSTDCYGTCKALGTDTDCSKCGDACKYGETCSKDKKCVPKCKPGEELCNGECKDKNWGTDKDCSKCGDTCKYGEKCSKDKKCVPKCKHGEELCKGVCKKNTWGTDEDCSKCDDKCPEGKTCKDKKCVPKCKHGEELCKDVCKKNTWGTDEDCSKCGDKCPEGKTCKDGKTCQHKQCKCPNGEKNGVCKK